MTNKKDWTLYILECADNTLYTGITIDIDRRLKQHKEGSGAKYTRGKAPFKVIYKETHKNRSCVSKRELEIKKMSKSEKLKLY